ncbi:unnamed protein product [Scytosiphon promiscuus]
MRNLFSTVRQRNLALGVAICGFAAATASIPFVIRKRMTKSLYDSEEGLTGSQIQRGAFMNSGSKDVGRDYDWSKDSREWTGRRNKPED